MSYEDARVEPQAGRFVCEDGEFRNIVNNDGQVKVFALVSGSSLVGGIIGAAQDMAWAESIAADIEATAVDFSQPTSPRDVTAMMVYNPSTTSAITLQIFTYDGSKYYKVADVVVPAAAVLKQTVTTSSHLILVRGLWVGGTSCRIVASNNTALGGGADFTATVALQQV